MLRSCNNNARGRKCDTGNATQKVHEHAALCAPAKAGRGVLTYRDPFVAMRAREVAESCLLVEFAVAQSLLKLAVDVGLYVRVPFFSKRLVLYLYSPLQK
jgi:hypothetical protein